MIICSNCGADTTHKDCKCSEREESSKVKPKTIPKKKFHNVQNPKHYHSKSVDPIAIMKQTFTKEELRGFFRGNLLKYQMRYQEKGGVEDLEKGMFYLRELIDLESEKE